MQEESSSVNRKPSKKKEVKIPTVAQVVENFEEIPEQPEKETVKNNQVQQVESADKVESEEPVEEPKTLEPAESTEEKKSDSQQTSEEDKVVQTEDSSGSNDLDDEEADEAQQEALKKKRQSFNFNDETAIIETILFLESEPQNSENLAKISQLSVEVVDKALECLKEKYSSADSGIDLAKIIGGWTLVPKKEYFDLVKEKYGKKNEGRLSRSAIETLSIIAYSQPITRAEIESIRHVSADNMIRVLIERNFICEAGKKDIPGKPTLYKTTKEFLEFFHLNSLDDLPQLDEKETERFELAR